MASYALPADFAITAKGILPPTGQPMPSFALSDRVVLRADAPPSEAPPALRVGRARIMDLLRLRPAWNSYGSQQITEKSAEAATDVLDRFLASGIPAPTIVPRVRGGLQLEWHAATTEVEIYVEADGTVTFFCDDAGEEIEVGLQGNESRLSRCLRLLG